MNHYFKSSNKKIRSEVDEGLNGKYDAKFIRSEKDLEKFLDKYGDEIDAVATTSKDDLNNLRKFTKGNAIMLVITAIGLITSFALTPVSVVTGTVTAVLTYIYTMVELIIAGKEVNDLDANIKYLKMIKRKLTKDIGKVKNPKIRDKYDTLIAKIERCEDEYTQKVSHQ